MSDVSVRPPRGLTLIEVIVGLSLVSVIIVVFGVSAIAATIAQRIQTRNMAIALADEQISVLQTYSAGSVAAQARGSLIGIIFAQGTWATAADQTAPSASNALALTATGSATGITAVQPFPDNAYADFTQSVKFKVATGSPSSWRAGMLFRGADLKNHYQAYVSSSALVLKKVVNGTETTLYSDARSVTTNVWHTLSVTATGASISVALNGTTITTQTDSTYTVGKSALAAWNAASVSFDDAAIGGRTWDFDATTVGQMHDEWLRFGLSNLPDGSGALTVTKLYGDDNVKKYDAIISWNDRGRTQSATVTAISTN